ncbi:MAG: transglycosylase family protein [Acidimicrobiales bacterium]|nr:transglycosylase family protein [Acidimicrobiales bacterium]
MEITRSTGRLLAVVLLGMSGGMLGALGQPAGAWADQAPGPPSQEALANQIAAQNNQLRSLALQYGEAEAHQQQVTSELATTEATLSADQHRVASLHVLLRHQAVTAFTRAGNNSATEDFLDQRGDKATVTEAFLNVTTDDIGSTVDDLRVASRALEASRATLRVEQGQAQAALASLSASRQSLLKQVASEEALLAKLRTPPPAGPPTPAGLASVTRPGATSTLGGAFAELRQCESSGNYATNTGNGFYGAYQFDLQTWHGLGYGGLPSDAPPAVQDQAAETLQAQRGWEPWPTCSRLLGL